MPFNFVGSEEWQAYTATVTAITGTLTTVGAKTIRYQRRRKVSFGVVITDIGTGTNGLNITLPVTAAGAAIDTLRNTSTNTTGAISVQNGGTRHRLRYSQSPISGGSSGRSNTRWSSLPSSPLGSRCGRIIS